jgi:beta-galactosidase
MVVVRASYNLKAEGTSTCIPCTTVYQILANGTIVVNNECCIPPRLPPLARVGVQFSVPGKLRTLRWFGRGPHETYPDR